MRTFPLFLFSLVALFPACARSGMPPEEITVEGKLTRVMAIGGESTGWAIHLDKELTVEGTSLTSLEVAANDAGSLESLADKQVQARGRIGHREGVERGSRAVLEISSIREIDGEAHPASAPATIAGTSWRLQQMGADTVSGGSAPTLEIASARVSGRAPCNRYFGEAKIDGSSIQIASIGSTRMACAGPVMKQEQKFFELLQAATRWEVQGDSLLICSKDSEQPLRFTRAQPQ